MTIKTKTEQSRMTNEMTDEIGKHLHNPKDFGSQGYPHSGLAGSMAAKAFPAVFLLECQVSFIVA